MMLYPVKKLARLAGVSVRTLHLYDELGLLKPHSRTAAGYRLYGEQELLRLQQILLYRELDVPLQQIAAILDDPEFDIVKALREHKKALQEKRSRIGVLLKTLDKTIHALNEKTMLNHDELYEGLPQERAAAYREEAIAKYGNEAVTKSENALRKMDKAAYQQLGSEQAEITATLFNLQHEAPESDAVQKTMQRHYENIRSFWGTAGEADKQAEAYAGLGQLYVDDERFLARDGKPQPEFAQFMAKAMAHFAETQLK